MFHDDNNERPAHKTDEMTDTFQVVVRTPLPPNSNVFLHDHFHMGTKVGSNVMVLHHSHSTEEAKYVILVHIPTGRRIQINLPEAGDEDVTLKARRCEEIVKDAERDQW